MVTQSPTNAPGVRYNAPGVTYIEWSPIIAGALVALAISIILVQFSSLFGLHVFEPSQGDQKTRWMVILTGVWLFWVQLISSMAGGYLAGRVRSTKEYTVTTESEVRDGAHGLIVWALATLIAVGVAAIGAALAHVGVDTSRAVEHHQDVAENLTKNAGIIFGFVAAAGSFVSAAASIYMAVQGGIHRDGYTAFHFYSKKK